MARVDAGWPHGDDPFCLRAPDLEEEGCSSTSAAGRWTPVTPSRLGPPAPPTYAAGFITPEPLPRRCASHPGPAMASLAGEQACRSGLCTPAAAFEAAWRCPAGAGVQAGASAGAAGSASQVPAEALPAEQAPAGHGVQSAPKEASGDCAAPPEMPAKRRRLSGKQPPPAAYAKVIPQVAVLVRAEDLAAPGGITQYNIRQRARWLYGDRRAAQMDKKLGNYAKRRMAARREFGTLSPEEQEPYLQEAEQAASQFHSSTSAVAWVLGCHPVWRIY
jgi:hypothetical protein